MLPPFGGCGYDSTIDFAMATTHNTPQTIEGSPKEQIAARRARSQFSQLGALGVLRKCKDRAGTRVHTQLID